jgi:hypothetical protein
MNAGVAHLLPGFCTGISNIQIDGNPIRSQEMLRKYKFGPEHLVDFLEKRMVCTPMISCSRGVGKLTAMQHTKSRQTRIWIL